MNKEEKRILREQKKHDETIARAEKRGYQYGENLVKDAKEIDNIYVSDVRYRHKGILGLYITFV
jgi:hypothetical protein